MTSLTRRQLLGGLSLSSGAGILGVAARERRSTDAGARSAPEGRAFDPAVDGFGFENYATPPTSPDPADLLSRGDVRGALASGWERLLREQSMVSLVGGPDVDLESIVDELYANANRLFGMRGYCFGMAAAAQWYFEEPSAIPIDRATPSDIAHVDAPVVNRSAAPVRDDVERFHRSQFVNVDTWLRRWELLRPSSIDYRSQERALRRAIDEFGTAGVTISGENVFGGHYVLLYDYTVDDTSVAFSCYDPNYAAEEYAEADAATRIGVDTTADEPLLDAYEEFDRFLFTPEDRDVRARAEPDRDR